MQISPRAERQLEIATRRLAEAEAAGSGRRILVAVYGVITIAARHQLRLHRIDLSACSMHAVYGELAPQLRPGVARWFHVEADAVGEQLRYYGEAIKLRHAGLEVDLVNGDAMEA